MKTKYNWQHNDWPDFKYNRQVVSELTTTFLKHYRVLIKDTISLPLEISESLQLEQLLDEATSTSAIEGIAVQRDSLRASIASKLFIPGYSAKHDPHSNAIVDVVIGLRELRHTGVNHATLWSLQHALIQSQIGNLERKIPFGYRTYDDDMIIADGKYRLTGQGKVFFVAPPSKDVPRMMNYFIKKFNATHPEHAGSEADSFARIATSHLWFESIHPFEDGNGRIGRAISDLALCQFLGKDAVIGISQQLSNSDRYYTELQKASRHTMDVSDWVEWFGSSLIKATIHAQEKITLAKLQSSWWKDNEHLNLNERQEKVIRKLFQYGPSGMEGGLTARKYSGVTRASKATATRDLTQLEQLGVLIKNSSGGRSTNYSLKAFSLQPDKEFRANTHKPLSDLENC